MSERNQAERAGNAPAVSSPSPTATRRSLLRRVASRALRTPAAERLREALRERMTELTLNTVVGLAERLTARLLDADEVATQLVEVVERAQRRHGIVRVSASVLRHSPLFDGSVLALLDPLLRRAAPTHATSVDGSREAATELASDVAEAASAIERGRSAVRALVLELLRLDEPSAANDDASFRLAGLEHDAPRLFEWMTGLSSPEDDVHVLLKSYLLFLQSFTLRTVMQIALQRSDESARTQRP